MAMVMMVVVVSSSVSDVTFLGDSIYFVYIKVCEVGVHVKNDSFTNRCALKKKEERKREGKSCWLDWLVSFAS